MIDPCVHCGEPADRDGECYVCLDAREHIAATRAEVERLVDALAHAVRAIGLQPCDLSREEWSELAEAKRHELKAAQARLRRLVREYQSREREGGTVVCVVAEGLPVPAREVA